MRNTQLILAAGAAALLLSGCTKTAGSGSGSTGSASLLIQSEQTTEYGDTVLSVPDFQERNVFTYDSKGRELSEFSTDIYTNNGVTSAGTDTTITTYGLGSDTVTGINHNTGTLQLTKTINYFNSDGTQLDSAWDNEDYQAGQPFTEVEVCTYDANGNCTEADDYEVQNNTRTLDETQFFTISGGNTIEETEEVINRGVTYVTTLGYGTVTGNIDYFQLSLPQAPLASHPNFNLLTTLSQSDNGAPALTIYFTYTFDSQHRVTSFTGATASGKPLIQYYNITYEN